MIVGTGLDVIEVDRVQKAATNPLFMLRVFTEGERAYIEQRKKGSPEAMAGTFAAKEAVSKALGTGFAHGVEFHNIEICHKPDGFPFAVLTGGARKRLEEIGGSRVHISISHIKSVAVAQAVIEDG